MKGLFFNHEFQEVLTWRGVGLRVGCIHPDHQKKIAEGFHNLSPASVRFRFLGSKNDFSKDELQYLTTIDGVNHFALGLEEERYPGRGIGIIRMVRSPREPCQSEVAITIIDDYQKMGIGTFLLRLLILAALERDIHELSFTFMPANEGIQRLIHKMDMPISEKRLHDSIELIMDIRNVNLSRFKAQLVKTLPRIGKFHLET